MRKTRLRNGEMGYIIENSRELHFLEHTLAMYLCVSSCEVHEIYDPQTGKLRHRLIAPLSGNGQAFMKDAFIKTQNRGIGERLLDRLGL